MAVNQPSGRGPRGRSRSRLSASAVTTWLRCPRQWYLTRRLGLRGPISPEQILGRVLEEAFCGLLMERPNASDRPGWAHWPKHHGLDQDPPESVPLQVASKADLDAWIRAKVPAPPQRFRPSEQENGAVQHGPSRIDHGVTSPTSASLPHCTMDWTCRWRRSSDAMPQEEAPIWGCFAPVDRFMMCRHPAGMMPSPILIRRIGRPIFWSQNQ